MSKNTETKTIASIHATDEHGNELNLTITERPSTINPKVVAAYLLAITAVFAVLAILIVNY